MILQHLNETNMDVTYVKYSFQRAFKIATTLFLYWLPSVQHRTNIVDIAPMSIRIGMISSCMTYMAKCAACVFHAFG